MPDATQPLLLIGGYSDGCVEQVPVSQLHYNNRIVVRQRESFDTRVALESMSESVMLYATAYRVHLLYIESATVFFGVADGMSAQEALHRIFAWYGQKQRALATHEEEMPRAAL